MAIIDEQLKTLKKVLSTENKIDVVEVKQCTIFTLTRFISHTVVINHSLVQSMPILYF